MQLVPVSHAQVCMTCNCVVCGCVCGVCVRLCRQGRRPRAELAGRQAGRAGRQPSSAARRRGRVYAQAVQAAGVTPNARSCSCRSSVCIAG